MLGVKDGGRYRTFRTDGAPWRLIVFQSSGAAPIFLFAMQPGFTMADDLDARRRRASYRAHHRGTKEMDLLVGRYADARIEALSEAALAHFERFLSLPDPILQGWIFSGQSESIEFQDLLADIRTFHQLAAEAT